MVKMLTHLHVVGKGQEGSERREKVEQGTGAEKQKQQSGVTQGQRLLGVL